MDTFDLIWKIFTEIVIFVGIELHLSRLFPFKENVPLYSAGPCHNIGKNMINIQSKSRMVSN